MVDFPNKLAAKLPEGIVNLGVRVKDVEQLANGVYFVSLVIRDGNNYVHKNVTCDTIVLAAPPVSLRAFSVAKKGLMPLLFAVHQRRLTHAYATSSSPNAPDSSDKKERIYRGFPDSILQQIVSGDYGQGVFQAAYACDRFERVWRELQYQGPDVLKREIQDQLAKVDLPEIDGVEIDTVHLCSGFVHRWHLEAHVNGKTKDELAAMAVYPQPVQLPRLHVIGEAFSSQQGWTEGALLTSMAAVDHILTSPTASKSPHVQHVALGEQKKGGTKMAYRGSVVDVSEWANRHPGGVGMIAYHGNEVIDDLFDGFHAGWPAPLATLFGLQCGVLPPVPKKKPTALKKTYP
jgi:monoamine oxidase